MENVALILMIPFALVATSIYRLLLLKSAPRDVWLSRFLKPTSYGILALFAAEVLVMCAFGPIRSRVLLGPLFGAIQMAVFLLGTPALENLLVLQGGRSIASKWFVAVPLCTIFAEALLLLQYCVSESLYGVNGDQRLCE